MKNIIILMIAILLSSQAYSETYPTLEDDLKLKFARSCSQTVRPWFSQAEYYEQGNENHFHEVLIKILFKRI